ncbi:bifunctional [glutamate--ammonia ligase]-adenylyl-L-tyrosine phosphorylase/[glutamate--ammonia-ligase] adenylyltransferase [Psychromonas algicola]|uniref:bifunctional [glutamate--ammonia ligase]-adenylyl-L-tyrosine phosphorylase/[glutamate--ammonia-ligase] adenylyltransferase n=1 Tax=Psychromonas algicola TaxID=2555642 RepID=UPI001067F81F|nr:bifunctional [glutamate--ammonia ligase]-adenylyl-L-tyrosine phosphorylase/[glutamate--ammonia-ligase] adenylyltransferase [Psychromonas sp. RZ5]TEW52752.1 bifunctional [glutamate--ammonia ligase]-adenylyl-L-tyrosine phosphorylase/[glutamate--ammonia-ligase] adenylyltransferase [Psychromonas sp. RZ5]
MSLLTNASQKHLQQLGERFDLSILNESQLEQLSEVFALSDFVAESLIKQPDLVNTLFESDLLSSAQRADSIINELSTALSTTETEQQLHQVLRQFRRKHMVVIAWRELLNLSTLEESFGHTSLLADQLILQSMDWLYQQLCKLQGTPIGESGKAQTLYVFAMGKLGGKELNFSSDIDLIFTYPERGETQGGRRVIENNQFFTKLGQQLIAALHQITVDGFVYRVDMRLRPFGESGPLVTAFNSIEDYYQTHGREWERYAMVKARVLGQEGDYKQELEKMLRPFVFRRYIDFSAIESLRKMKAMISAEVRRKGLKDNIKLGMGGIREIEFVAQAFQLIHGGRHSELQCKGLQQALSEIAKMGVLPEERVNCLLTSYHFLRSVENVLQQIGDQQTQTLPDNELDKLRLIKVMKFDDWDAFYQRLNKMMANVHREFNWVIGESEEQHHEADKEFVEIWELALSSDEMVPLLTEQVLAENGQHEQVTSEHIATFAQLIVSLKQDISKRPIGPRGQETIDKLLPRLIELICAYPDPESLFERIHHLILNIMSRTAYLELLNENEGALKQLLTLCSASSRVAAQLARHPILLDELLDPQKLYHPTELAHYKRDLQQFMLRIPEEDMEQQMEALRQFKQMQFLHIATADIAGGIKLPQVSDHLTCLSEAILEYVVHLAWAQMVEKFGLPSNVMGTDRKGFAVIGYGKMGGLELGYGSDLDVVFLHDSDIAGTTNGARSIDNQLFYFRLAQRMIHLFSSRTNSGILYEIDMRLRPSGDSGPLVASMAGFCRYLKENAWTWEHQALVRTRPVFIDSMMLEEFKQIRLQILSQQRDQQQLKKDVSDMRAKMRAHLNRAEQDQFDLKQSPGGMVDIEFIAQYLVLANAHQFPEQLSKWSDNLRIFAACEATGLLTQQQANNLIDAYCHIRDAAHRLTLGKETRIVDHKRFASDREIVMAIWNQLFGE